MLLPTDLNDLLSASGDIAYDWDLKSDSIAWYGAIQKVFDGQNPPQDSQGLYHILHTDDRHIVFSGENSSIDRQFRIKLGASGILWINERGAIENDTSLNPVRQRGVWRLIEQPAHGFATVSDETHDSLTNTLKRVPLQTQIKRSLDSVKSSKRIAAYLTIGVDKMSFVNEAVGTEAGDAVLRGVAHRLTQLIPTRASLGRVSGDVFGILLPDPLGNDLQSLSEKIIHDFRDAPVIALNAPMHITVSVGGVRMPTVAKSANEAMIYAEQALHMARQRGRDTFVEYIDSPERAQENRQLLELSERIKRAFKNNGFRLAYQPIVAAETGKPVMYESLVRMFADDGKPISAALFVPMIEQIGLAEDLDRLVLDMAIRDMEECPSLCLAVNVSGITASKADWPDYIRKLLEPRPDVARRLVIEITETAALASIGETLRFVETLRGLGGRISLDDFGAGATSIRYLRELGLSIMKIDKDLLKDIATNPEQQHLVSVLIGLARGLGIQTVAEGVETEDMAAWLRKAKVDFMQGYFFGKPTLDRPEETATSASTLYIPAAAHP